MDVGPDWLGAIKQSQEGSSDHSLIVVTKPNQTKPIVKFDKSPPKVIDLILNQDKVIKFKLASAIILDL